jgi:hypothetical protein
MAWDNHFFHERGGAGLDGCDEHKYAAARNQTDHQSTRSAIAAKLDTDEKDQNEYKLNRKHHRQPYIYHGKTIDRQSNDRRRRPSKDGVIQLDGVYCIGIIHLSYPFFTSPYSNNIFVPQIYQSGDYRDRFGQIMRLTCSHRGEHWRCMMRVA